MKKKNKVGIRITKRPIPVHHGLSKHPLYKVWIKIKDRLYNKNHEAYHLYGGNGVIMCKEWLHDPERFIRWALENGWKKGLQIDKDIIPRKLGLQPKIYSPEMCSIVTSKENNNNASYNVYLEYGGRSQTIAAWSDELNIDAATLHHRLFDYNYSVEEAFTLPIGYRKNIRRFEYNGEYKTLGEWAKLHNIKHATMFYRVDTLGLSISEAINFKKTSK